MKDRTLVMVNSSAFRRYIAMLEYVANDQNYCICLSCWQFVSLYQLKLHQHKGHICVRNGIIASLNSYLHYCDLFQYMPRDNVVTFFQRPQGQNSYIIEQLCHDTRFGNNFSGVMYGQPPYLNEPLCPFNQV